MDETPNLCAIDKLAEYVLRSSILTSQARSLIEAALIDTLGCVLAGSQQSAAIKARGAARYFGSGSAPIIGTAETTAAPVAAFVNAVAGHASEFDDWELPGNTHPSVVLFPAILAIASFRTVSGNAVAEAYTAGFEVIARLGEAFNFEHYDRGWHSTATLGTIGAAAAACRLLDLSPEQTRNALSIATSRATGYTCQFGSNVKPLQAGFAAENGVTAALLAAHDLTGQAYALDADTGFNALMAHGCSRRLISALQNLGRPPAIEQYGLVMKRFPSCGYTHRVMDCALELRDSNRLTPDCIQSIEACLPDFHAAVLPFDHPANRNEAFFSVPFCVAAVLQTGDLDLQSLDNQLWLTAEIKSLISKTRMLTRKPRDPCLNYDANDPDWLQIVLVDGNRLRAETAFPTGSPDRPLTVSQVMEKFQKNLSRLPSVVELDGSMLIGWTQVDDFGALISSLTTTSESHNGKDQAEPA